MDLPDISYRLAALLAFASLLLYCIEGRTPHALNPFSWFPHDNYDVIARKMDKVNPDNCASKSEADLRLPPTSLSQLPKYNEILLQQWFTNRSKLLHLHNMALNRAFFYSYINQRLDGFVSDPFYLPSLMYFYMSAAADVSSSPGVLNVSALLMDTNTTYANWYGIKNINHTLPLFGPFAQRLDNWNDETNYLRVPTNKTVDITDLGAGPRSNYTAPWYRNNPYIRDREMGIDFIPDKRGTAPSKSQFVVKIQLATPKGQPIRQLETTKFYGPNAPGEKETFLPVRFTRPYYDCGKSNRWIVSSVAGLSDYMPRYSNFTRLRGPRIVGIIVQSMDFYRIDFNPCATSQGNPQNFLSGVARCKPSTLCVPLPGYGFRRGGYECVCQPGYRLPYAQYGPFRGIDIEQASREEYENGFDCLPIGWLEVIPEESVVTGNLTRRRRSLVALDDENDYKQIVDELGPQDVSSIIDLPSLSLIPDQRDQTANPYSHLMPLANYDLDNESTSTRLLQLRESNSASLVDRLSNDKSKVSIRIKRQIEQDPFYTLDSGSTFDADKYNHARRLVEHAKSVTAENCHQFPPDKLQLPGDVSYGVEKQFEMAGRTALRLAHFLSAYYQNNVAELYGSLLTGFPLNRFELFGEVFSNVLSNFDIVSSGIFFDYQMFKDHDGETWDLFAPYAYKMPQSTDAAQAIDMSINYYRKYPEKPWFRALKERWTADRYGLEEITTKPHIRSNINGTQIHRYFNFPMYYKVAKYEDGFWTQPYFDCDGLYKDWLITYAAPFFGYADGNKGLRFMGVTTISIRMMSLDIQQCPQPFSTPNFFKNTARCDFRTTYCKQMPRRYFQLGSYKCECLQGFEYPFNAPVWFYDGEMMELEYELWLQNKPNRYPLLRCRQGVGALFSPSILSTLLPSLFLLYIQLWS